MGNAIILLSSFFMQGAVLTAFDGALGSGSHGRSGLGRTAEL
jgi:hypothetical protein